MHIFVQVNIAVGVMPQERQTGIVYEELMAGKSAVFVHSSHPLKSKRKVSDAHLRQYPWIVFAISGKEEIITAYDDTTDKSMTRMSSLFLACLLMQKGTHVMHMPLSLAPVMQPFDVVPIKHKPSEVEFISGLFYQESVLLLTASREMIKEIRNVV